MTGRRGQSVADLTHEVLDRYIAAYEAELVANPMHARRVTGTHRVALTASLNIGRPTEHLHFGTTSRWNGRRSKETRRTVSVRTEYENEPLPEDALERLLEAVRQARIVVLEDGRTVVLEVDLRIAWARNGFDRIDLQLLPL